MSLFMGTHVGVLPLAALTGTSSPVLWLVSPSLAGSDASRSARSCTAASLAERRGGTACAALDRTFLTLLPLMTIGYRDRFPKCSTCELI